MGKKRQRNAKESSGPAAKKPSKDEIPDKQSSNGAGVIELSSDNEFLKLEPSLSPSTLQAIGQLGFDSLTPVQGATIPRFMSNQDVAVEAITGSGKTLAFVIPTVEILLRKEKYYASRTSSQWGAIILSPTRELAKQITSVTKIFGCHTGLSTLSLIGGTKITQDLARLREAHLQSTMVSSSNANDGDEESTQKKNTSNRNDIIVGTPGRVNDVITRGLASGIVSLKELEVLVLDEADVLLDMGFQDTINNILTRLPKQRRTGLFSATQTRKVKALIRAGLRNPSTISVKVNVDSVDDGSEEQSTETHTRRTPTTLGNFYTVVPIDQKLHYLIQFLLQHKEEKAIVFFATCACVEFFGKVLSQLDDVTSNGVSLFTLHGKMVTKRRNLTFESFTASPSGAMLCTDVAARGIDLPDVDWIVQYDPPQDPDVFVHRVGRTARAGRSGKALVMVQPNEDAYIPLLRDRDVPVVPLEEESDSNGTKLFPHSSEETLELVKKLVFGDRDILESGTRAFISYLRSYKEHRLSFIFRIKDLELLKVTKAFVLLQLPKLSEFRDHAVLREFKSVPNAIVSAIAFKDKAREKHRQANIKAAQEQKAKEELERKQDRAVRMNGGRQASQEKGNSNNKKAGQEAKRKKKGRQQMLYEEWDELAAEERLHKQFKKGKLTKKQLEHKLRQLNSAGKLSSESESEEDSE